MSKYNKYNIGEYLYNRLPSHHKVVDISDYNRILERYLEVLNSSFKLNMEDLDIALARTQASKCPEEYLDKLAMSLGADWINTISPKYQRQIISMLIKLYQQKGAIDTIRFIASELSGFEAKIIEGEIPEEYFEPGDELKRLLTIKLQAPEIDDPVTAQEHETTIAEVIGNFVPVHTKYILVVTYFYDEPHYKRFEIKEQHFVDQKLGETVVSVNAKEVKEISKIQNKYEYNTDFGMLLSTIDDNMYQLTIPTHRLVENFRTVRSQYDQLRTKVKTLYDSESAIVSKSKSEVKHSIKQTMLEEANLGDDKETITKLKNVFNQNSNFNMLIPRDDNFYELGVVKHKLTTNFKIVREQFDVVVSAIKTLPITYDLDKNNVETKDTYKVKQAPFNNDIVIGEELSTNSKVVVKYNQDVKVKDLGINCRVLKTGSISTKISSITARTTNPSFIDKITVNNITTYKYE